jgi:hypothetical protein
MLFRNYSLGQKFRYQRGDTLLDANYVDTWNSVGVVEWAQVQIREVPETR